MRYPRIKLIEYIQILSTLPCDADSIADDLGVERAVVLGYNRNLVASGWQIENHSGKDGKVMVSIDKNQLTLLQDYFDLFTNTEAAGKDLSPESLLAQLINKRRSLNARRN